MPRPVLRALVGYFLGLGTWGFGGPIAAVGYMQRDLVERRSWLDRNDFLNGVALGQTMPGPLAAQVAMWVGYLERGPLGARNLTGWRHRRIPMRRCASDAVMGGPPPGGGVYTPAALCDLWSTARSAYDGCPCDHSGVVECFEAVEQ